jgi:hypothetical protein
MVSTQQGWIGQRDEWASILAARHLNFVGVPGVDVAQNSLSCG